MNPHQDNAQESNAQESNAVDPHPTKMACTGLAESATTSPAEGPVITSIGVTDPGPVSSPEDTESCVHTSCVQGAELSAIGLSDPAPVDPHEVRARLTRRGSQSGLELDGGTGVVFIPQHALPDLRRRLLLAQERFTAMSGPVPGKRRKRRPASAR